jgi:FlaA1/EpsC-like NDP-sugar epimerase
MRIFMKYLADLAIWTLALPLAYFLRIEARVTDYAFDIAMMTVLSIPIKASVLYLFKFHRQSWTRIGVLDLFRIIQGVLLVTLIVVAGLYFIGHGFYIPRSVPVIEAVVTILALGSIRLFSRVRNETIRRSDVRNSARKVSRVLVAGAGEAGTMLAREVRRHPESYMEIVGFLDDNPTKEKEWYLGYAILGSLDELPEVAHRYHVDKVIIAMPTADGDIIRKVVTMAQHAGIESQIMPGFYELLRGNFNIAKLRKVDVTDLLGREQVQLDVAPISRYLYDRTVLVTGAGGSIGSEIVRQLIKFNPRHVLLLGRGENSIFKIERELQIEKPEMEFTPIIADVRDLQSLEHVFEKYRPQVVFHAAAHKHVPLMEANPDQAVLNNIGGTRNLTDLSLKYGVERFVNVSSDKSVNPTSIMGCSKRVAEYVVHRASLRAGENQSFVSVRFGNVLGSRGSVVPLFKQQIEAGGPVTVTHPEMTRYFMTIPEASQLVIQAGGLNNNGSIYVLDMGSPVKIVDLARDLIRLCGYTPDIDIQITFSGMRPGEKLYEELLTDEEGTSATRHSKIFKAKANGPGADVFEGLLQDLFESAHRQDHMEIRRQFKRIVPSYSCEKLANQNGDDSGLNADSIEMEAGKSPKRNRKRSLHAPKQKKSLQVVQGALIQGVKARQELYPVAVSGKTSSGTEKVN